MRYAIMTNPSSGRLKLDRKKLLLEKASHILRGEIVGLDVKTREDFVSCARKIAPSVDILVVAGGDGTVSDVINALDTAQTPIAYLPLGSGNALAHGLKYPSGFTGAVKRILKGSIREYDLILCNGRKKALIASLGIEGTVLRLRDNYLAQGVRGLTAYSRAFFEAYFRRHRPFSMEMILDDEPCCMDGLLSLSIMKHPCYGYGLKLIPPARLDDGKLHLLCTTDELWKAAGTVLSAFTIGNRFGTLKQGTRVEIRLEKPLALQTDGDLAWEGERFTFEVLPKALKIKC
jgi:diacylglycerol kinase family enzyme